MAGYNSIQFDLPLLTNELNRVGRPLDNTGRRHLDAMRIFHSMERRDLSAAMRFYCSRELVDAHSALADAAATLSILDAQVARYDDLPKDVQALHVAPDGDIWIQNSRGRWDPPAGVFTCYDVFDGEGNFKGSGISIFMGKGPALEPDDTINPAAKTDPTGPLGGMPVLDVENYRLETTVGRVIFNDGDGVVDSVHPAPTHDYELPGSYTVSLAVSNHAGSDAVSKPAYICVTGGLPDEITGLVMLDGLLTLNGPLLLSALTHVLLPAMVVAAYPTGLIARLFRASLIETLGEEHVRMARAIATFESPRSSIARAISHARTRFAATASASSSRRSSSRVPAAGRPPRGRMLPADQRGDGAVPDMLVGMGVPARIVRSAGDLDRVRPGDVLIAPITTSPWEVVFPHIGALVTEGGGLLSHPAIVAREYRLPAVVGCEGALSRFHDGQPVTVNGTAGTVRAADTV